MPKSFIIVGYDGEPNSSFADRRRKRSGLKDVASMIRSFHYVSHRGIVDGIKRGVISKTLVHEAGRWANAWRKEVTKFLLKGYFLKMKDSPLIMNDTDQFSEMLKVHILEKALYEIGHELLLRRSWLEIPLQGTLEILSRDPA